MTGISWDSSPDYTPGITIQYEGNKRNILYIHIFIYILEWKDIFWNKDLEFNLGSSVYLYICSG